MSTAIHCYVSEDGRQWQHRSTLGAAQDANEQWLLRLGDGRIMIVFRTNPKPAPCGSGCPQGALFQAFSSTDGRSWSTPTLLNGTSANIPHRVEPKLVRLPAIGALVLSSGRLGQYIWTVLEADLQPGREHEARWTGWDVQKHHDATYPDPRYHFASCGCGSTYYSSLTVLGDERTADSVVLSYDHLPEAGSTCGHVDSIFTVRLQFKKG